MSSSVPWGLCSVTFVLDLVDPSWGLELVGGLVLRALGPSPLPAGWSLSHVGVPAPGSAFPEFRAYRATMSVVGRCPSLADGCEVLRRLSRAGLSSVPRG
jgi:hypothetical protein